MKKRGLSQVVTTVLLILIVLTAVSVIWAFVRPTLEKAGGEIGIEFITINMEIVDETVSITENTVDFRVKRNAGAGNIVALKVILEDIEDNEKLFDFPLVIEELETVDVFIDYSGNGLAELRRISIAPVFENEVIGNVVDVYVVGGSEGGGEEPICEWGFETEPDATCDIRASTNSKHNGGIPLLDLDYLGMSNNSFSLPGFSLLAGVNVESINWFINRTEQQINDRLIDVIDGQEIDRFTDGIITLDMEPYDKDCDDGPDPPCDADVINLRPKGWHNLDPSIQNDTFDAFRLRIDVARNFFPNAKLIMYGIIVGVKTDDPNHSSWEDRMEGYRAGGMAGVYDNLDAVSPVLYLAYEPDDPRHSENEGWAHLVMQHSSNLTNSTGSPISLIPRASLRYRNNLTEEKKFITPEDSQLLIDIIQDYDQVDSIVYWIHPEIFLPPNSFQNVTDHFENIKAVPCGCFES